MYPAKALLAAAVLGLASLSPCAATTVTDVTFVGNALNPLVMIFGSGFDAAMAPTSLGTPGFTGQDYGTRLHLLDWTDNPNAFDAGYDDPSASKHDALGLDGVSISDTLIAFQFGSEYVFYGAGLFQLAAGDAYTIFVDDARFDGTVRFSAESAPVDVLSPEPGSAGLILSGLAGLTWTYRRRVRISPTVRG